MSDIIIPSAISGKEYPSWAVKAVDRLMTLANEKPMWEVLDFVVIRWMNKNIKNAKLLQDEVIRLRGSRLNEYASTVTKKGDVGSQRHLGEMPREISFIVEFFYKDKIEEMGRRKFYYAFFKRYKIFRVAQTL